jgi:alkylhydroperoxidase family enzyme
MAVSVTNALPVPHCRARAAARCKGLTPEQRAELVAIIGRANEANAQAATLDLPIDGKFRQGRVLQ